MPLTKHVLAASVAAAALFAFAASFFGTLFLFTPVIPLVAIGYFKGRDATFLAAALGALFLSPFGMDALLVYLACAGVPSALWIASTTRPFPDIGLAITEIVFFTAAVNIALHLSLMPLGGLEVVMLEYLKQGLAAADPGAYTIIERFPFLPAVSASWWFIIVFYVHARLARFFLKQIEADAMVPELRLSRFTPPHTLLYALPAFAIIGFSIENQSFITTTLFLIFLLPYAINGFITTHSKLKVMRGGSALLALLYVTSVALIWPVFVVAGIGMWQHVQLTLTKK